jgi:hypothetical protein
VRKRKKKMDDGRVPCRGWTFRDVRYHRDAYGRIRTWDELLEWVAQGIEHNDLCWPNYDACEKMCGMMDGYPDEDNDVYPSIIRNGRVLTLNSQNASVLTERHPAPERGEKDTYLRTVQVAYLDFVGPSRDVRYLLREGVRLNVVGRTVRAFVHVPRTTPPSLADPPPGTSWGSTGPSARQSWWECTHDGSFVPVSVDLEIPITWEDIVRKDGASLHLHQGTVRLGWYPPSRDADAFHSSNVQFATQKKAPDAEIRRLTRFSSTFPALPATILPSDDELWEVELVDTGVYVGFVGGACGWLASTVFGLRGESIGGSLRVPPVAPRRRERSRSRSRSPARNGRG